MGITLGENLTSVLSWYIKKHYQQGSKNSIGEKSNLMPKSTPNQIYLNIDENDIQFTLSIITSHLQNQHSKIMLFFRGMFAAHFIARIIRDQRL